MAQRTKLNRPYGRQHEDDIVRDITELYENSTTPTHITETYEIGDWNMDTATFKVVTYTTTQTGAPVAISGVLRSDTGFYYPIHAASLGSDGTNVNPQVNIQAFGDGEIYMARTTGGDFDGSNFDSTSYNRGWITITYLVA
jgi:hypothetical protein